MIVVAFKKIESEEVMVSKILPWNDSKMERIRMVGEIHQHPFLFLKMSTKF